MWNRFKVSAVVWLESQFTVEWLDTHYTTWDRTCMCIKLWTHLLRLHCLWFHLQNVFVTVLKAQTPSYLAGLQKQTTEQGASIGGTEWMCGMTVRALFSLSTAWILLVGRAICQSGISQATELLFSQHAWMLLQNFFKQDVCFSICYYCQTWLTTGVAICVLRSLWFRPRVCSLHECVFCHSSKVPSLFYHRWIRLPEAEERETGRAQWY